MTRAAAAAALLAWASEGRAADVVLGGRFGAGDVVYTATDAVNLRVGPSTDAAVVRRLPFGTALTVIALGEERAVGGRTDRWYLVERPADRGWIFGGTLTAAAFSADLDRDGHLEAATAAFTDDARLVLRVREADGTTAQRVLGAAGDPIIARMEVTLTDPAATGAALLRVAWDGGERWLTYGNGLLDATLAAAPGESVTFDAATGSATVTGPAGTARFALRGGRFAPVTPAR